MAENFFPILIDAVFYLSNLENNYTYWIFVAKMIFVSKNIAFGSNGKGYECRAESTAISATSVNALMHWGTT